LTVSASTTLPRVALFALAFAYILAGLFMRDPWKTDDVVGVAAMLTARHDGATRQRGDSKCASRTVTPFPRRS